MREHHFSQDLPELAIALIGVFAEQHHTDNLFVGDQLRQAITGDLARLEPTDFSIEGVACHQNSPVVAARIPARLRQRMRRRQQHLVRGNAIGDTEHDRTNAVELTCSFARTDDTYDATLDLDGNTWSNYRSSIVNGPLSQPHARTWWANTGQHMFDPELSAQIAKDLAETPENPPFLDFFSPTEPAMTLAPGDE